MFMFGYLNVKLNTILAWYKMIINLLPEILFYGNQSVKYFAHTMQKRFSQQKLQEHSPSNKSTHLPMSIKHYLRLHSHSMGHYI